MLNEKAIENHFIDIIKRLGYNQLDNSKLNRINFDEVIMKEIIIKSIIKINNITEREANDVFNIMLSFKGNDVIEHNKLFSKIIFTNGKSIELNQKAKHIRLFDFENIKNNQFNIVSQLSIKGHNSTKIPDIILYINGFPIVIFELKNMFNRVKIEDAYTQIENYKQEIPDLFKYIQFNIISDGNEIKVGTLTSKYNRYGYWKEEVGKNYNIEEILSKLLEPSKVMNIIKNYISFNGQNKILMNYHQYNAIEKIIKKIDKIENTKGGVVWHTQGSGKSFTMAFLAMNILKINPTASIIVITDRIDLDQQLFNTFTGFEALSNAIKVENRKELKEKLSRQKGGIYFSTVQKFDEEQGIVNELDNIYIIADEAHRSQNNLDIKLDLENSKLSRGYALNLRDAFPNGKFIGFTGTPLQKEDKATIDIFGNYIDIYSMIDSTEDETTVPLQYKFIKQNCDIDNENLMKGNFINGQEDDFIEMQEQQLQMEEILGDDKRIKSISKSLIDHLLENHEQTGLKAMLAVSSRTIASKYYETIKKLYPNMISDDLLDGEVKVIITASSSDKENIYKHKLDKEEQQTIANRLRDKNDKLKLVIVVDMWLTGFDAPILDTLFIDKNMKEHNLMQALARVNRVYEGKLVGNIIDYYGIAKEIIEAMKSYTNNSRETIINVGDHLSDVRNLLKDCEMLNKYKWLKDVKNEVNFELLYKLEEDLRELKRKEPKNFELYENNVKEILQKKRCIITELSEIEKIQIEYLEAVLFVMKARNDNNIITNYKPKNKNSLFKKFDIEINDLCNFDKSHIDLLELMKKNNYKDIKESECENIRGSINKEINNLRSDNLIVANDLREQLNELVTEFRKNQLENYAFIEGLKDINEQLMIAKKELEGSNAEISLKLTILDKYPLKEEMVNDINKADKKNIVAREIIDAEKELTKIEDWKNKEQPINDFKAKVKRILIEVYDKENYNDIIYHLIEQLYEK